MSTAGDGLLACVQRHASPRKTAESHMTAMPERPSAKHAAVALALAVAAVALAACGSTSHEPFIARVGSSTITRQALRRAMAALAPEHIVPDPPSYSVCIEREQALALTQADGRRECQQQYQTLERQALALLISWQWLAGAAATRDLTVSTAEIHSRLREDGSSATPGPASSEEQLLARAELLAAKLRQAVLGAVPPVTHAQLLDYYHSHTRRFERPELRYIKLTENFESFAEAERGREDALAGAEIVRAGVKFAHAPIDEIIEGTYIVGGRHTTAAARRAIFAAKPRVLSQPVKLNAAYSFFEITRIVPAHLQSFAQIERPLRTKLEGERQKRALGRAVEAWRREWAARTDCAPGYVIQRCRQYKGAKAPESPLAFD
jgi:hypothetical protein